MFFHPIAVLLSNFCACRTKVQVVMSNLAPAAEIYGAPIKTLLSTKKRKKKIRHHFLAPPPPPYTYSLFAALGAFCTPNFSPFRQIAKLTEV